MICLHLAYSVLGTHFSYIYLTLISLLNQHFIWQKRKLRIKGVKCLVQSHWAEKWSGSRSHLQSWYLPVNHSWNSYSSITPCLTEGYVSAHHIQVCLWDGCVSDVTTYQYKTGWLPGAVEGAADARAWRQVGAGPKAVTDSFGWCLRPFPGGGHSHRVLSVIQVDHRERNTTTDTGGLHFWMSSVLNVLSFSF